MTQDAAIFHNNLHTDTGAASFTVWIRKLEEERLLDKYVSPTLSNKEATSPNHWTYIFHEQLLLRAIDSPTNSQRSVNLSCEPS
ncbi:hypothetical protein TB1_043322 [Malus domestica]